MSYPRNEKCPPQVHSVQLLRREEDQEVSQRYPHEDVSHVPSHSRTIFQLHLVMPESGILQLVMVTCREILE